MEFSSVPRFGTKNILTESVWSQLKPVGGSEVPKRACVEQREVNQRLGSRHPYSMREGKEESYKRTPRKW